MPICKPFLIILKKSNFLYFKYEVNHSRDAIKIKYAKIYLDLFIIHTKLKKLISIKCDTSAPRHSEK